MSKATKAVTGETTLSYVNLNAPKAAQEGAKPKYSASVIIPKSDKDTLERINKAIQAAYEEGESVLKGSGKSVPALDIIKTPLRDGDKERPDDEAYANSYFINANSINKPGIVDRAMNPIIDTSEIYSGMKARVSINFYAFNVNGNRGIAAGLGNVQKVADGTPLGGSSKPEDDFEALDDDFLS